MMNMTKSILLMSLMLIHIICKAQFYSQEQKKLSSTIKKNIQINFESTPILETPSVDEVILETNPLDWKPSFSKIDPEVDEDEQDPAFEKQRKKAHEERLKYFEKTTLINNTNLNSSHSSSTTLRQVTNVPTIVKNFDANEGPYSPFDNSIAIATNGTIVSMTNHNVNIYNSTGSLVFTKELAQFFGYREGQLCDPRVIYDDAYDRFVLMCQTTDASINQIGESKIEIMVAKATNLSSWKKANLPGNIRKLVRTSLPTTSFDYPSIAFSKEDIFITGNMFNVNTRNFVRSVIYQISKSSLYSSSTTKYKFYYKGDDASTIQSFNNVFTLCPLKYADKNNTIPGIYLTAAVKNENMSGFFIFQITTALEDNPSIKSYYITNTDFDACAYAPEKNKPNFFLVPMQGYRVMDGFYDDEKLHFVFNAAKNGDPSRKSSIFYTQIDLSNGLSNSMPNTTKIISSATNFYAYPRISPSNHFLDEGTTVCSFLSSGSNSYPSFLAVALSANGTPSRPVSIKNGDGYYYGDIALDIGNGNFAMRWGDYSGMCRNVNDGSVWVAGTYTRKIDNNGYQAKFRTHIAKLSLPRSSMMNQRDNPNMANKTEEIILDDYELEEHTTAINSSIIQDEQLQVGIAPNPVSDFFSVFFTLKTEDDIKVTIVDLNGKAIKSKEAQRLDKGPHSFTFDRSFLASGIYFLIVENGKNVICKEKIIIK